MEHCFPAPVAKGTSSHLARYTSNDGPRPSVIAPILRSSQRVWYQMGQLPNCLRLKFSFQRVGKMADFKLKGDLDLDNNTSNDRILYLDRNLDYRITLDKLTYSKAFMIGMAIEDSDQSYEAGILGNGSGQADILVRFSTNTPSQLFYFCPDQEGAGGPITVKDFDDLNKPNQRTDILLTFSYGQPARAYQILIKQALNSQQWSNSHRTTTVYRGGSPTERIIIPSIAYASVYLKLPRLIGRFYNERHYLEFALLVPLPKNSIWPFRQTIGLLLLSFPLVHQNLSNPSFRPLRKSASPRGDHQEKASEASTGKRVSSTS